MPATTFTTTLSELNRLFGLYHEIADKKTPNSEEAQKAWMEYENYVRQSNKERGTVGHITTTLPPLANSCSRRTAGTSSMRTASFNLARAQ